MKTFATLIAMGTALAFAAEAGAANIVYFRDFALGPDRMAEALENRAADGDTVVMAGSAAEFQSELESGAYDVGIFFVQSGFATSNSGAIEALGAFVADGGAAIYADWSRNGTLAAPFGAAFDGVTNQTVMAVTHPELSAGLGDSVMLMSPGWFVFSTGLTGPSPAAVFENGSAAIVIGHEGRSIVNGFMSDTFANGADGVRLYENQIALLLGGAQEPVIEVAMAVRPGGDGGRINLGARGALPVAVLSTEDFDALEVDEATVLFGDPLAILEGGTPVGPIRSAVEDVDGDGVDDLMLFFSIAELAEQGALNEASVAAMLSGLTFDGMAIEGVDAVRTLAPPARGRGGRGR